MAPRVVHTVEGAEALRKTVMELRRNEPSITTSRMGITTFIQRVLRNGTKFSPRRSKTSGTRSGTALSRGRAAHRMVDAYCKDGTLPPRWRTDPVSKWARGIAEAIVRAGIEPLRTELPCALASLRTCVDMVGMVVGKESGKPELVAVEFKTTSHTHADHKVDYDSVCQRRSVLGAGLGLPNSEREAHRVQAAFGACALGKSYEALSAIPIRACVIVASRTSTACYNVKPIDAGRFQMASRMGATVAKKAKDREKLTEGRLFPHLPSKRTGGAAIRATLTQAAHTNVRRSQRASCLTNIGPVEFAVGVVEGWTGFSVNHRKAIVDEITEIAGEARRPALVIFDTRRSLWRLHYP